MRNTLKHLTLLTRMKDDGLLPALTGSFSEDAIAQACGQVETLQLQERLHIHHADTSSCGSAFADTSAADKAGAGQPVYRRYRAGAAWKMSVGKAI